MVYKNVYCVICGAVRYEFPLLATLTKLIEMRSNGLLSGILLSTWKGELENYAGLSEKLEKLGVYILENERLPDTVDPSFVNVGYLRQAEQLRCALDILPDDAWVLKARTDRALPDINRLMHFFENNIKLDIRKFGNFPILFENKIVAFRPRANMPFFFKDFVFFGRRNDLYKQTYFCMHSNYMSRVIWADAQWFIKPFALEFPLFRDWLRLVNYNDSYIGAFTAYVSKQDDTVKFLPQFLRRVYALAFLVYHTHFYICGGESLSLGSTDFGIKDIFCGDVTNRFARINALSAIYDNSIIDNLLNFDITTSAEALALHGEIMKFSKRAECIKGINREEYEELRIFIEQKLKLSPQKYLKHFLGIEFPPIETDDAVSVLFAEMADKKEIVESALVPILSDTDTGVVIFKNAEKIKDLDMDLYHSMLIASATERFDGSMSALAAEMALGRLSERHKQEVSNLLYRYILMQMDEKYALTKEHIVACYHLLSSTSEFPAERKQEVFDRFLKFYGMSNIIEAKNYQAQIIKALSELLVKYMDDQRTDWKFTDIAKALVLIKPTANPFTSKFMIYLTETLMRIDIEKSIIDAYGDWKVRDNISNTNCDEVIV